MLMAIFLEGLWMLHARVGRGVPERERDREREESAREREKEMYNTLPIQIYLFCSNSPTT